MKELRQVQVQFNPQDDTPNTDAHISWQIERWLTGELMLFITETEIGYLRIKAAWMKAVADGLLVGRNIPMEVRERVDTETFNNGWRHIVHPHDEEDEIRGMQTYLSNELQSEESRFTHTPRTVGTLKLVYDPEHGMPINDEGLDEVFGRWDEQLLYPGTIHLHVSTINVFDYARFRIKQGHLDYRRFLFYYHIQNRMDMPAVQVTVGPKGHIRSYPDEINQYGEALKEIAYHQSRL